jgi:hypothetical protein
LDEVQGEVRVTSTKAYISTLREGDERFNEEIRQD